MYGMTLFLLLFPDILITFTILSPLWFHGAPYWGRKNRVCIPWMIFWLQRHCYFSPPSEGLQKKTVIHTVICVGEHVIYLNYKDIIKNSNQRCRLPLKISHNQGPTWPELVKPSFGSREKQTSQKIRPWQSIFPNSSLPGSAFKTLGIQLNPEETTQIFIRFAFISGVWCVICILPPFLKAEIHSHSTCC